MNSLLASGNGSADTLSNAVNDVANCGNLASDIQVPINLGSSELVTINGLVDIVEEIAGVKLKRTYNLKAPKGVNGRNSDNTLIKEYLGWEPGIRLREGLEKTYRWIYDEIFQKR